LIETRVADAGHWFLDTFVRSGLASQTLYGERLPHPFGLWYHIALVCGGGEMRHYVNGQQEMGGTIDFVPLLAGQTSLGVRLNRVVNTLSLCAGFFEANSPKQRASIALSRWSAHGIDRRLFAPFLPGYRWVAIP
jgi:hypothetical protein